MKAIALNFVAMVLDYTPIALDYTPIALNYATMALNYAVTALLMPLTRGRPLMISTIGGHTATPPAPSPHSHNLISPDVGRKSGDS